MASRRGPDNSVRVAISGTSSSVNWANVFHCQLATSGSIAQADLDTWTTAFQLAFKTRFAPYNATSVLYASARTVLYAPGGGELSSLLNMTGTGSGGTVVQDQSASLVVSWLTSVYWRGGKPRSYLAGAPATMIGASGTQITTATQTALQLAAQNFRNDINALTAASITGTTFGFCSFQSGNVERPTSLFFPITGARVHLRLGTQRRRLGRWLP